MSQQRATSPFSSGLDFCAGVWMLDAKGKPEGAPQMLLFVAAGVLGSDDARHDVERGMLHSMIRACLWRNEEGREVAGIFLADINARPGKQVEIHVLHAPLSPGGSS